VDERIIENVITGRGEVIDSQDQVGGWDSYPEVLRPDEWDIDHDGIPSEWETMHGLDPRDSADRNEDKDGDGYTNLEEYMNAGYDQSGWQACQVARPRPRQMGGGLVEGSGRVVLTCPKRFRFVMLRNFGIIRQYLAENSLKPIGFSGYYEPCNS
jgi:hypothetical protein